MIELAALLLANLAFALLGAGLLVAAGVVDRRPRTWPRLGAAHLLGVAAVVVPSTYLALAGIGVGWTGIGVAVLVVLGMGGLRVRGSRGVDDPRPLRAPRWTAERIAAGVLLGVTVALLAWAVPTFAAKPLLESDGWSVWALKARILYELPDDAPKLLRDGANGPVSYPLGMPVLEAVAFRAVGRFDSGLADVQLLALAFGFVGGTWAVTRGAARGSLVALPLLVAVSAPQFLSQLGTNYVDVPLAMLIAFGVASCGAWLSSGARAHWLLACAAAGLGTAGLFKNEGLLFALAACVALAVAAAGMDRAALRHALLAVGAVLLLMLPWRVYTQVRGLGTSDYDLADAFDPVYLAEHADRVWPVTTELIDELTETGRWGFVAPATVAALVAAYLARRWRIATFAALWLGLAFGGLVLTYWITKLPLESDLSNSSYRTIVSILLGGLVLIPLLVGRSIEDERSANSGAPP